MISGFRQGVVKVFSTSGCNARLVGSSNGGVMAGIFASTFSWVFCQGGVWMAMEVWTW